MFVHGENSTLFLLLPDPDPEPGNDAGDSSGVPIGGFLEVMRFLRSFPGLFCAICSLEMVCFREEVVGGLGGRTLNPADIMRLRRKSKYRCYTLMKQ